MMYVQVVICGFECLLLLLFRVALLGKGFSLCFWLLWFASITPALIVALSVLLRFLVNLFDCTTVVL